MLSRGWIARRSSQSEEYVEHFSILEEPARPDGAIVGALKDLAR